MNRSSERIIHLLNEEIKKIQIEMDEVDSTLEEDIYAALSEEFKESNGSSMTKDEKERFVKKYYDILKEKKIESLKKSLDELVKLKEAL
jgi:hypothetical protein